MSKLKKSYCKVSVIFAVFVLIAVVLLQGGQSVYATGTADGIETPSGDDIPDPQDPQDPVSGNRQGAVSATSDSTNGISFSINNEEGTLSGALRILLTLTAITLLPSVIIMLTSFTRIIVCGQRLVHRRLRRIR